MYTRQFAIFDGERIPMMVRDDKEPCYTSPVLCPVCGKYAFYDADNYEVCPVCSWENESRCCEDEDAPSDLNDGVTLKEAKKNYKKFGSYLPSSVARGRSVEESLDQRCNPQRWIEKYGK